jgi:hypothetical protein
MTALSISRRHHLVRLTGDGAEDGAARTELAMTADSRDPGEWRPRGLPAGRPDDALLPRAREVHRELCGKGAVALGGDGLLVEAGTVEVGVAHDGRAAALTSRSYLLVRDGDRVLQLRDGQHPPDTLPWVRAAGPQDIRDDDPVVLGASALLALIAARQEEAGANPDAGPGPEGRTAWQNPADGTGSPTRPAASSPYPPHDLGLLPPPGAGIGRTRADLAQGCEILCDPALWLVPHGTFTAALRPAVRALRLPRGRSPARALVIETLTQRGRCPDGRLEWVAAYCVRDASGTGRGSSPLIVRGTPAGLLRAAVAACGPQRPALARDPIGRAYYLPAAPVATSLRAQTLVAGPL